MDSEKFLLEYIPIYNWDQMPLHQNESTTQKTMTFKNMNTYVKENCSLSRERAAVFTQVSSDLTANFIHKFIFKGKGTRIKLNPPKGMKVQWSGSETYPLEHMLQSTENPFRKKDWEIYVFDNHAVHIMPEIRKALKGRDYLLVLVSGGITGSSGKMRRTFIGH